MFYVLLTGAGEGCDYTIGCNKIWKVLNATTIEEATKEVAGLLREEFSSHEHRIQEATIIDVLDRTEFDCRAEYQRKEDEDARQRAELEKHRRAAEFEKLKREFGS